MEDDYHEKLAQSQQKLKEFMVGHKDILIEKIADVLCVEIAKE